LPPRFGLLAYVVDSYRRGRADDVTLIPVSIAYDQISDVQDYAREQLGGAKHRESFGWLSRGSAGCADPTARSTSTSASRSRSPRRSARRNPEAKPDPDEDNLALQKLAFEVCVRINAVTPITPVVARDARAARHRRRRADRARRDAAPLEPAHRRRAPRPAEHRPHELATPEGVARVLDALAANEVVDRFAEGSEPVYRIGVQRELAAAYYRNSVIHFFVDPAIAEVALLEAAEAREHEDRVAAFWRAAMQLRDL